MKKHKIFAALLCALLVWPTAVSALNRPTETVPFVSHAVERNGNTLMVEHPETMNLLSAEVQEAIQKFQKYDVKTLAVLPGGGIAVTFNIPEHVAPAQEWTGSMKKLHEYLKELQVAKPPIGPKEFFSFVYPDQGDTVPFSTWKNGYYYAGLLQKMEYHHAESGIAYYEYKGWIQGYDPDQVSPDAIVTEVTE